ncbi:Transcriptional regulator PadR-like family protein [uncultured archaeon]|nr:Transcriptional regulator PadR-like family protein [uncultured archaeon]
MEIIGKTKVSILSLLSGTRLHGYEIAKRLSLPITGIYQHLKDLKKAGFTESKLNGRKKEYYLTERGKKLLELVK